MTKLDHLYFHYIIKSLKDKIKDARQHVLKNYVVRITKHLEFIIKQKVLKKLDGPSKNRGNGVRITPSKSKAFCLRKE